MKNIKLYLNKLFLVVIFVTFSTIIFAQNKKGDKIWKKFESQKVAYITQELDLTPKEASVFWPLYYDMKNSLEQNEKKNRILRNQIKNNKKLVEKDYEAILLNELDSSLKREVIIKDYYRRMLKIISPSRLLKLRRAEYNFKKILFSRMGRGRNNSGKR